MKDKLLDIQNRLIGIRDEIVRIIDQENLTMNSDPVCAMWHVADAAEALANITGQEPKE